MTRQVPLAMTAVTIREFGGPDVLAPEIKPVPLLKTGEILVRVAAAGINRPDILQRQGAYPPPPGAPDIPGLEIAGEVIAISRDASRFKLGDRICALVPGGGYAEYCAVHATNALPIPDGVSMIEAAGIPETFFTVWTNVFERGALEPGETLLVHGGASGIGTTAIMLAKAFGSTVITTAGSDRKCAVCLQIGADIAINYRTTDFVVAVRKATSGRGADVILDMVGGGYISRNYDAAALDGRIVQIALQGGAKADVDYRPLMTKRLTHTGSTLRPRSVLEKAKIADQLAINVWPILQRGLCRPIIHAVFPLTEAAAAHSLMESGQHIGKIVLCM